MAANCVMTRGGKKKTKKPRVHGCLQKQLEATK